MSDIVAELRRVAEGAPLFAPVFDRAINEIEHLRHKANGFDWVLTKIRKHWPGYRPPTDGRGDVQDAQGSMHVLVAHAHGYEAYIAAHKCEDKQGEIARLAARVKELEQEIAELQRLQLSELWPRDKVSAKEIADLASMLPHSDRRQILALTNKLARDLIKRIDKAIEEFNEVMGVKPLAPVCLDCGASLVPVARPIPGMGPCYDCPKCGKKYEGS